MPRNNLETPRKTPRKGAFANILHKRSRLRKKLLQQNLWGFLTKQKRKITLLRTPGKYLGNTRETPGKGAFTNVLGVTKFQPCLIFCQRIYVFRPAPLIENVSKCTFPRCFPGVSRVFPGSSQEDDFSLLLCQKSPQVLLKKFFFSTCSFYAKYQ